MKRRFAVAALAAMAACSVWMATPATAQRGATRPRVQMPQGAVREVIRKNCTACHGIDDYAFFALDRSGWQSLIETKHKTTPVSIPSQDLSVLLDWLVSKFGPSTKPFPRTYVAPEIKTFFSDPEAKRLLNRACTTCHGLDRVETT